MPLVTCQLSFVFSVMLLIFFFWTTNLRNLLVMGILSKSLCLLLVLISKALLWFLRLWL